MAPSSPPNNPSLPAEKGKETSVSQPANGPAIATGIIDSAQAHEQSPTSSTEADKDGRTTLSNSTFVNPDDKDKSVDKHSESQPSATKADDKANADASRSKSTKKQKLAKATAAADGATSASSNGAGAGKAQTAQPSSAGAAKGKQVNGQRAGGKKSGFMSKLMSKLIPCAGPNKAHSIDLAETPEKPAALSKEPVATKTTAPASPPRAPAENEKQVPSAAGPVAAASAAAAAGAGAGGVATGANEESKEVTEKEREKPTIPPLETTRTSDSQESKRDSQLLIPPTPTKSLLPVAETGGATSGAVQPPGSTGTDIFSSTAQTGPSTPGDASATESEASITDDEGHDEQEGTDGEHFEEDDEDTLIMNGGAGIPIGPDGVPRPLLPPIAPQHAGRKCLVLDLDETLVHSSFKSLQNADYVVPVEIEYHWHNVYVIKRPGVDNFLKKMGEIYEVVVFTASLSKYADPVLDKLDIHHVVTHRLFRESCYNHKGNYVKDLSQLGRPIADTIILDNSPASYIFHPNNAVPVSSWFNDPHDTELTDLCPFLADLGEVPDVRGVLDGGL